MEMIITRDYKKKELYRIILSALLKNIFYKIKSAEFDHENPPNLFLLFAVRRRCRGCDEERWSGCTRILLRGNLAFSNNFNY